MNYDHPYTFKAQKAVISIPVVPQVTGVVNRSDGQEKPLIKRRGAFDWTRRYQARVDRLMADIVTAEHKQRALGAELDEMAANTQQAKRPRDKFAKRVSTLRTRQPGEIPFSGASSMWRGKSNRSAGSLREVIGGGTKVDPSQLDSLVLGERSQIASWHSSRKQKYNLEQTMVHCAEHWCCDPVLIRPGTTTASTLPLRPVMVFIPTRSRNDKSLARFRQNSLLRRLARRCGSGV